MILLEEISMKKFILILIIALTLSACSFEDLFAQLARSDVEQAADVSLQQSQQSIQEINSKMDAVKPQYGENALLTDITDGTGFGTAYRNQFDSSTGFVHHVIASLDEPQGSNFYEGWLVIQNPSHFISTGRMEKDTDGQFVLNFTSPTDYTDHLQVVITLETTADSTPETHILEGSF